ncbi:MAG: flippase-like domain-containing protein [Sedimentisphaerales bacterium]|nr:flippase-like domain-containing protein [Sedimentisphaerales bacterium]
MSFVPKYRKALQWVLAVFCVLWVGWHFYHNRQDLGLFGSLSWPILLILLGLFTLHLWLYSLNLYYVIMCCAGTKIPFIDFFKTIIIGRFLSSVAPQAGGVWRAIHLKHKFGISYTRYIGGFLCFLWLDAAMNILLSIAIFALSAPTFAISSISIWIILGVLGIGWFIPLLLEKVLQKTTIRAGWLGRLHEHLSTMITIAVQGINDPKMLIRVIVLNTTNFANNILIFYLCLSGSQEAITLAALAVFFILLKLSSYIIITPGNVGIREIAYGLLAHQMGLAAGAGIVLSVFYRLFGMIIVSLFGIYFGGLKLLANSKRPKL